MVLVRYACYFNPSQYTSFPIFKSALLQYPSVFFRLPLSSQEVNNGVIDITSPPVAHLYFLGDSVYISPKMLLYPQAHTGPWTSLSIPDSTPTRSFILPTDGCQPNILKFNFTCYYLYFKVFSPLLQSNLLIVENLEM